MNKKAYSKDFDGWNVRKKGCDSCFHIPMFFAERDIWWCMFGVNIGNEIDGRGTGFSRPVVILRKKNRKSFIGVPLTGKIKHGDAFFQYDRGCIVLGDVRSMSAKRLMRKKGKMDVKKFEKLQNQFVLYLSEKDLKA